MRKQIIGAAFLALRVRHARLRQSQRLRLRARIGRAGARDRRRQGHHLHRHHRHAGPAPDPGAPSLIAKARAADITVCAGAELEIGWLPMVEQAVGQREYPCRASPARSTRHRLRASAGTASGARPRAGRHPCRRQSAHPDRSREHDGRWRKPLADRFAQLDPANAAVYQAQLRELRARACAPRIAKWQAEAAPLRGVAIAVQHHSWIYMLELARHARSGAARAQAGRAAVERLSRRGGAEAARRRRPRW